MLTSLNNERRYVGYECQLAYYLPPDHDGTGYPLHRENRENGHKNSLSGKTQGICVKTQTGKKLGKLREFENAI